MFNVKSISQSTLDAVLFLCPNQWAGADEAAR